jgi:uroporphyrin-III C-methyltransferase/precorrin-2 dehydrogenase/sirohydrochlorin ferrochelatase
MSASDDAILHPLFLKLKGRTVLVIGAGAVAERKISALLDAGARLHVVAPAATSKLKGLAGDGTIEWSARSFEDRDADGTWLIVAATGDRNVQRQAAAAGEARRVFVVAVDDPGNASAYSGAIVRRAPFTIAISSSGATPALTRLLREVIEYVLPGEDWVDDAKRLRAKWTSQGTPMGERFGELVQQMSVRRK